MRTADVLRSSLQSLCGNAVRSSLTVLGLAIGVGACIAIGSLGAAAVDEVRSEMDRFGVDRLWVEAQTGSTPLGAGDVRALQTVGDAVAPMCYGAARVTADGSAAVNCALVATTSDYAQIENLTLAGGRFLRPQDEQHLLRAAVIEDETARTLFGSEECLGERIELGDARYTVVGVLRTRRSEYFVSEGKPKVYLPLGAWRQQSGDGERVDEIIVRASAKGLSVSRAASAARAALRTARGGEEGVVISSMAEQIASADRIILIVSTVLCVIGVICMVTGGVGVMNVLLTGVRERRREIGIRKALGARDREIFSQFVCEAAGYGAFGAALGAALGALFTLAGEGIVGIEAPVAPWAVLLSIAFALMVGAICGVYPAMRAAQVPPVTAMRQM